MPGFIPSSPEEFFAQMQQQAERAQMVGEARRMSVERMLEDVSPEHLATMKFILEQTIQDKHGTYSAYMVGVMTSTLQHKHHRCTSCGADHGLFSSTHAFGDHADDDEQDEQQPTTPQALFEASVDIKDPSPEFVAAVTGHDPEGLLDSDGKVNEDMLPPGPMANMQEKLDLYEVELVDSSEPYGPVRCKNCGITNPSLEDRMLRRPGIDGCGSCQIRSAHG